MNKHTVGGAVFLAISLAVLFIALFYVVPGREAVVEFTLEEAQEKRLADEETQEKSATEEKSEESLSTPESKDLSSFTFRELVNVSFELPTEGDLPDSPVNYWIDLDRDSIPVSGPRLRGTAVYLDGFSEYDDLNPTYFEDEEFIFVQHSRGFESSTTVISTWKLNDDLESYSFEGFINHRFVVGIGGPRLVEVIKISDERFVLIGENRGGDAGDIWGESWLAIWHQGLNNFQLLENFSESYFYPYNDADPIDIRPHGDYPKYNTETKQITFLNQDFSEVKISLSDVLSYVGWRLSYE